MSIIAQINEFLNETRDLTVKQLNNLIQELDHTAITIGDQAVAHSVLGYMQSAKIKGETANFADAFIRAKDLKARHNWLYVDPTEPSATAPITDEVVPAAKPVRVKGEKKSDIAAKIYAGLTDRSKENVIRVFMEQLGTTHAGAQTYYYTVGGVKTGRPARKASTTAPTTYVRKTPERTGPSKREVAAKMFAEATVKTRAVMVERFVQEIGMTVAGATTYFYAVGGQRQRAVKG
jgi:hypothetical protein